MPLARLILAVLLLLVGGTFALQGFNLLPGSYMTGRPEWAIIGSLMVLAALALFVASLRRKAP
jgi:hypothetical protein